MMDLRRFVIRKQVMNHKSRLFDGPITEDESRLVFGNHVLESVLLPSFE
jgi:hypothetical protein